MSSLHASTLLLTYSRFVLFHMYNSVFSFFARSTLDIKGERTRGKGILWRNKLENHYTQYLYWYWSYVWPMLRRNANHSLKILLALGNLESSILFRHLRIIWSLLLCPLKSHIFYNAQCQFS